MHKPTIIQGTVGKWHVDELADTGVLTKGVKFSLNQSVLKTKAHVSAAALNQTVRTRVDVDSLMIDFSGEAIPDQNGKLTGLANVFAGQNIATCAHFAADVVEGNEVTLEGRTVFGFKRDSTKLLQVNEPTIDLSPENPAAIAWKAEYFEYITHDAAAA